MRDIDPLGIPTAIGHFGLLEITPCAGVEMNHSGPAPVAVAGVNRSLYDVDSLHFLRGQLVQIRRAICLKKRGIDRNTVDRNDRMVPVAVKVKSTQREPVRDTAVSIITDRNSGNHAKQI